MVPFRAERRRGFLVASLTGVVAVSVTLVVNLVRLYPVASLAVALAIAGALHRLWARAGRPSGVSRVEQLAEQE